MDFHIVLIGPGIHSKSFEFPHDVISKCLISCASCLVTGTREFPTRRKNRKAKQNIFNLNTCSTYSMEKATVQLCVFT